MLIKLLPPASQSTASILFTLNFASNIPTTLPLPPAWASNLQSFSSAADVKSPRNIHCLDKSAWLVALTHEIVMDMDALTLTATFNDGQRLEWPLHDKECIRMLESVMADVRHSSAVDAGAVETEAHKQESKESSRCSTPTKRVKHKKQRSLLLSLIASLVSIPRSATATPPPLPPSPPPTPPPPPGLARSNPMLSPRTLRRRARSTLVDAWRRHILTFLSARAPRGGYGEWAIRSLIREIRTEINELLDEAEDYRAEEAEGRKALDFGERDGDIMGPIGGRRNNVVMGNGRNRRVWRAPSPFRGSSSLVDEDPFLDDEDDRSGHEHPWDTNMRSESSSHQFDADNFANTGFILEELATFREDGDSTSTDTDGSSVHTPNECDTGSLPLPIPPPRTSPSSRISTPRRVVGASYPKPSTSTPSQALLELPEHLVQPYNLLTSKLARYRHMLAQLLAAQANEQAEQNTMLSLLEIRSRRRAWSAGIRIAAHKPSSSYVPVKAGVNGASVWDGTITAPRKPGPIMPLGLELSVPVNSSPLKHYNWTAENVSLLDVPSPWAGCESERSPCGSTAQFQRPERCSLVFDGLPGAFSKERYNSSPYKLAGGINKEGHQLCPVSEEDEESLNDDFYFGGCQDRFNFQGEVLGGSQLQFPESVGDYDIDDPFFYPYAEHDGNQGTGDANGQTNGESDGSIGYPMTRTKRPRTRSMYLHSPTPTYTSPTPSPPLSPPSRPASPPPQSSSLSPPSPLLSLPASCPMPPSPYEARPRSPPTPIFSARYPPTSPAPVFTPAGGETLTLAVPPPPPSPPVSTVPGSGGIFPPYIEGGERVRSNTLDASSLLFQPLACSPPGQMKLHSFLSAPTPGPLCSRKDIDAPICARKHVEAPSIVFARDGEEYSLELDVELGLGRAEEGRGGWC